jgi:dipeptidyl aminopeptidase/acylaminoacyl peptidase
VPDAGVIYLILGSELIRYDGATGSVAQLGSGAEFDRATAAGTYVVPYGGPVTWIAWDGMMTTLDCGELLRRVSISVSDDCAGVKGDLSLTIRQGTGAPRVVVPPGGGALDVAWRPDGREIAVVKRSGQFENSLWVIAPDGIGRQLYAAPRGSTGDTLYWPSWSPDGSVIAVVLNRSGSFSLGADGGTSLLLVSYPSGTVVDLGLVPLTPDRIRWSADGALVFVRGAGREPAKSRKVILRERDGIETSLGSSAVADHPAWDPAGVRIVFTETDETGTRFTLFDRRDRSRAGFMCPSGEAMGARWAKDGDRLLLLCHERGSDISELWLRQLAGAPERLMTVPRGFIDLFRTLSWSEAAM